MDKQTTINQHYVPQCLLKGFLNNNNPKEKDSIHIYDFNKKEFRLNVAIKSVFSQNYFYDTNNEIEKLLCEVETKASLPINKLRMGDYDAFYKYKKEIIIFISTQFGRTRTASDSVKEKMDKFDLALMQDIVEKNKFYEKIDGLTKNDVYEYLKSYHQQRYTKVSNQAINAGGALVGLLHAFMIDDLNFHIIENKTLQEFIISDHPVILYNYFYHDLKHPLVASPCAKGAQLFVPISKDKYICLYDKNIYKYGIKKTNITQIRALEDVKWFNELQRRSGQYLIGFSSDTYQFYIERLMAQNRKPLYSNFVSQSNKFILVGSHINKVNFKPSFFNVLKKAKVKCSNIDYRDREKYHYFSKELDKYTNSPPANI